MKRRKNPQIPEEQDYDYESLREDRKYGLYWFSGLWKILRPVLIGLCALLIVFGVLSTVWSHVQDKYLSPVDPADDTEIAFSVETGNSLSRVSRNLESAGLIKNSSVFKYYCDFAGMGQKIQAGDYKVKKSMDLFQIAQLLTTGDGRPTVTDITIIPGYTIENIANYLKEKGILQDTAEFLNLCKTGEGVTDYYFLQDELKTQNVNSRKYLLEGYLAPNTYEVYLNATPKDIVKKLLDQTDYVFSNEWQERAAELGMTMDQTLTLHDRKGSQEGRLCQGVRRVPQPPEQRHEAAERPHHSLCHRPAPHGPSFQRSAGGFALQHLHCQRSAAGPHLQPVPRGHLRGPVPGRKLRGGEVPLLLQQGSQHRRAVFLQNAGGA